MHFCVLERYKTSMISRQTQQLSENFALPIIGEIACHLSILGTFNQECSVGSTQALLALVETARAKGVYSTRQDHLQ